MEAIPYTRHQITAEDIDAVSDVLLHGALTQGAAVPAFEAAFADYVGAPFAVAVANGTAALHLAALALGVNTDSKVITTPLTFVASANAVLYCGGTLEFCDTDPATGLMDLDGLEHMLKQAKPNTYAGIIPVSLAGYPVNLERMRMLADAYDLWILHDACHAPGAAFLDSQGVWQRVGNGVFEQASTFSLHPAKHIAAGEGGVITTRSQAMYEKLCLLRTHGINKRPETTAATRGNWYYEMLALGYNYRFPDILAALAHSQLKRAPAGLERRRELAQKYQEALADLPLLLPQPEPQFLHAYHLYIVQTPLRDALYSYLHAENILVQVHYIPVYWQPYYQQLGFTPGLCPQAESFYQKCLSLPLYPDLSDAQQNHVIQKIRQFFNG